MKILIAGRSRSGKDSMAEILHEEFGLTYKSSSMAAVEIFIFNVLKYKYHYKTMVECFEDRVNHRSEWFDLITNYNKEDRTRLTKEILKISDCYVGLRNIEELNECKKQNLFDLIVWVDAGDRVPFEDSSSCTVNKSCADIIIENDKDFDTFKEKVIRLGKTILKS